MTAVVLLIHEHPLAQRFIRHVLEQQGGYVVVAAADSDAALTALHQHDEALEPDVLLTGARQHAAVMASVLRRHQGGNRRLPVVVLEDEAIAITPAVHRVAAEPRDLLLKLKSVLRPTPSQEKVLEHEGLRLDPVQQQAYAGHLPLNLTALGFRLLHFLMANPGRVYSRAQLLETVWAGQAFVEERTVDVHVYRLRNQLTRYGYGHLIEAVRGSGYRFTAEPQRKRSASVEGIRFAP